MTMPPTVGVTTRPQDEEPLGDDELHYGARQHQRGERRWTTLEGCCDAEGDGYGRGEHREKGPGAERADAFHLQQRREPYHHQGSERPSK